MATSESSAWISLSIPTSNRIPRKNSRVSNSITRMYSRIGSRSSSLLMNRDTRNMIERPNRKVRTGGMPNRAFPLGHEGHRRHQEQPEPGNLGNTFRQPGRDRGSFIRANTEKKQQHPTQGAKKQGRLCLINVDDFFKNHAKKRKYRNRNQNSIKNWHLRILNRRKGIAARE